MKYLLDTHTFLWTISGSEKIPESTRAIICDADNEIHVSSVSFWEISIKTRLKKLDLGAVGAEDLIGLSEEMGFQRISLTPEEAVTYGRLEEASHFDPFDRMLIWQALSRKMTVISKDAAFSKFVPHGLKLLWR
jgi:PIN domain nuclease of toxin-antitoxin system